MNILDLNDDCLGYVMPYLAAEDGINFAQVCRQFRDVFIDFAGKRYREFVLDANSSKRELVEFCICKGSVRTLIIDLDHFDTSRAFRDFGCESPCHCFGILLSALEGMDCLRSVTIKQTQFLITPIEKPFEQIFSALRNLKELKYLEIRAINDWTYENLWQLNHLEQLQIHVKKLNATVLAKCCKANPKLRNLELGYDCVEGQLKVMVAHCGNLETLKFGMLGEASAYQPLAKMPKLRKLSHYGIRRKGSFVPLLKGLAVRPQLQQLEIDGGSLSPEEIQQIIRLRELQQLKCFCLTAECVEQLAQLAKLERLTLWMSSRVDISNALLKVVRDCHQLQLLRVASGTLNPSFVNDASKLLLQNRRAANSQTFQLEIPIWGNTSTTDDFRNKLLSCSPFERDSWNLE